YIAICLVHYLIGLLQACLGQVERIGIFHQKLACPHYPEAGTNFVSELGLDLIKIDGNLFIASDFVTNKIRYDLLVCRAETKGVGMTILEAGQFRTELLPASRLLP